MNFMLEASSGTLLKLSDIFSSMKTAFSEFTIFDAIDILFLSVLFFRIRYGSHGTSDIPAGLVPENQHFYFIRTIPSCQELFPIK